MYECSTCEVALCADCHTRFHKLDDYHHPGPPPGEPGPRGGQQARFMKTVNYRCHHGYSETRPFTGTSRRYKKV